MAVAAAEPLLKVAPAPAAGAANVTVTPLSGLLPASLTVACREANAALTARALRCAGCRRNLLTRGEAIYVEEVIE